MQTKTRGCDCGCGCGGGGGCGCRSAAASPGPEAAAACAPCETGAFVRPRFFAGQLLTEDDLDALVDYTLAKQRFHHARLFGAGVVCGLEVTCGPCDSSQLVVDAGYAIDGCGNDVVLACARTLDVAPMIRELQARVRGGVDCSDPCPPPPSPASPPPSPASPPPSPASRAHRYDLYARYTERPEQPVAAYPIGGDCDVGAPSCEPTRIVEGIAFELRCPPLPTPGHTMADRLAGLPPDLASLIDKAIVYARYHGQLAHALQRQGDALDRQEVASLREGSVELESLLAGRSLEQRLVAMGQYLTQVGGPFTRMQRAQRAAPPGVEVVPSGVDVALIAQNLTRAADAIDLANPKLVTLASERALVKESAALWKLASDPAQVAGPVIQLYLGGVAASAEVIKALTDEITPVVARLQAAAGCQNDLHTDCALREQLDGLTPRWNLVADPGAQLSVLNAQLGSIVRAIDRFVEDLRCAAIVPPCPESDGSGVLLARIEVDRCKVLRICNTVRSNVLAPAALRYWGAVQLPDPTGCCGPLDPPPPTPSPDLAAKLARLARVRGGALPLRSQLGDIEDPEPNPAALAGELAELRRTQALLEQRLSDLESAARATPPPPPPPPPPTPTPTPRPAPTPTPTPTPTPAPAPPPTPSGPGGSQ